MTDESWVDELRPEKFSEIQGNNSDLREIRRWIKSFEPGDKPQLLVGKPGTGKTTTAYVTANEYGYPLNEINASDKRGSEGLEEIAKSINTNPVNSEYQVVLIDETDSQSHKTDKKVLVDALKNPSNPVFLTANEEYQVPNSIKRCCDIHNFKLGKRSIKAKLKEIADKKDVDIDQQDLKKLAQRGELRSAITDLQKLKQRDIPIGTDDRTERLSEFDVIDKLLRGEKESGGTTPPDLVQWLNANLSEEFRGLELAMAYDALSKADKYLKYAKDENNYKYWKYTGELAEQTAHLRLSEPYGGYINKNFPNWFRETTDSPEDENPKASLYRKLKGYNNGEFNFSGDYAYFRNVVLDYLKDLDIEEKRNFSLYYDLTEGEMEVIGLDSNQFEDWKVQDLDEGKVKTESELNTNSTLDW